MTAVSFNLETLASKFECQYDGDPETLLTNVSTLSGANKTSLSFFSNQKYKSELKNTKAGVVVLSKDDYELCPCSCIFSDNPYLVFARISQLFDISKQFESGIHENAYIDKSASIGKNCGVESGAYIGKNVKLGKSVYIGANSVIHDNTTIGDYSWIGPGVKINNNTLIGSRAIIHSGVVIGADGFGFSENNESKWIKIPQISGVSIGNDVEIGANTTIDRGTLTNTIIKDGVKLDNQIQIAHNVIIGEDTAIVACTAIAGSTVIGKNCKISGQVGISGHLTIADNTTITARTAVMKSIKKSGVYSGNMFPHQEFSIWQKNVAQFRKLSQLKKTISDLIKKADNNDNT